MLKKSIKGIMIIAIIAVIVFIGVEKYIQSMTTVEYGQLPADEIPKQYEKVIYTVPTVDEQGRDNEQTFTVDNEKATSHIVKLAIRNKKVKGFEFIDKRDVPHHIQDKLSEGNF